MKAKETGVSKDIHRIFISVSILWLGYLFLGLVIALIWWVLTSHVKGPIIKGISPEFMTQLRNILVGIGVVEILIGLWLKNRFTESIKPDSSHPVKAGNIDLSAVARAYAQAHLVPSALALSVSFYALIIGLAGGDKNSVVLTFIISFFGLWLFQPRIKQLRLLIKQVLEP